MFERNCAVKKKHDNKRPYCECVSKHDSGFGLGQNKIIVQNCCLKVSKLKVSQIKNWWKNKEDKNLHIKKGWC